MMQIIIYMSWQMIERMDMMYQQAKRHVKYRNNKNSTKKARSGGNEPIDMGMHIDMVYRVYKHGVSTSKMTCKV